MARRPAHRPDRAPRRGQAPARAHRPPAASPLAAEPGEPPPGWPDLSSICPTSQPASLVPAGRPRSPRSGGRGGQDAPDRRRRHAAGLGPARTWETRIAIWRSTRRIGSLLPSPEVLPIGAELKIPPRREDPSSGRIVARERPLVPVLTALVGRWADCSTVDRPRLMCPIPEAAGPRK